MPSAVLTATDLFYQQLEFQAAVQRVKPVAGSTATRLGCGLESIGGLDEVSSYHTTAVIPNAATK